MIILFSGSGNTLLCARELASLLDENILQLDAEALREPTKAQIAISPHDKRVIWAFPCYSWGVPPVMVEFIKNFKSKGLDTLPHYMFTTCGDDTGYMDRRWRRLMRKRNFKADGAFSIQMPNTYVVMSGFDVDSPVIAQRKIEESHAAVEAVAQAISHDGEDILVRGAFPWIKSYIIYPWFVRYAMSPKPFSHTTACTACGTCSATCPMKNITATTDGTPRWGKHCAMCLRCYHICPQRAIAYGRKTEGKGQKKCFF